MHEAEPRRDTAIGVHRISCVDSLLNLRIDGRAGRGGGLAAVHHHDIDGRAAVRCLRRYGAQHVGQVVCRRIGCAEDALSRKRGRQRIAGAWRMVRRKRVRIDLPQQVQTVTSGVHLISSLWTAARFAEVDGAGDLAVHDGH